MVDALDIHVDANGSAVRFWIAASDPTYWAIEVDKGERNELGERDSLEQCLDDWLQGLRALRAIIHH